METEFFLLALLVVLIGSFIQGVLGYGVTLFSAPLLFLINPVWVPVPLIIIGGVLPLLVYWSHRKSLEKRDLLFAYPGSLLGVLLAATIVGMLSQSAWQMLFSVMILLAVLLSLCGFSFQPRGGVIFLGSWGSGLMGTLTSVGGPPLGLAYQNARPDRVRASLSAIFIPTSVFSLLALYAAGRVRLDDWLLAISLFPAVILGFYLSRRWGNRVSPALFRHLVLGMATLSAGYSLIFNLIR
ncbi:hypothetical protein CKO15_06950 [Halorhodospira abdelmalekii]|uniref:sulfite exporter TauE/SafE family protein n=1 Tax=Halorhodospira abdelmalekii TaxID=421629 RepID=UPI0019076441|nr:sulfite exporter TauE/SafE family protein [Halorhodospira abdelmalekii]MBK1735026.1 hypothetical protein [Halorhodospira abdelmalekii]